MNSYDGIQEWTDLGYEFKFNEPRVSSEIGVRDKQHYFYGRR